MKKNKYIPQEDLCKTCEHFWLDFPMPLDKYIAHCTVLDKNGGGLLDDVVDYPCLKCPFNSYNMKADTKMRTCDKLEMEKLYGEEY